MEAPDSSDRKSVSAHKKKYRFSQEIYDALEDLCISDDDRLEDDGDSDNKLLVDVILVRKSAQRQRARRSRLSK